MAIKMFFHYNTCYLWVFLVPNVWHVFLPSPFCERKIANFSLPMKKSYTDTQFHFICDWLKEWIVTFREVFHIMSRQWFWIKCLRILVYSLEKKPHKYNFRHSTFSHVQVQWVNDQYCESPRHFWDHFLYLLSFISFNTSLDWYLQVYLKEHD